MERGEDREGRRRERLMEGGERGEEAREEVGKN